MSFIKTSAWERWLLSACGVFSVLFSLVVLGFVSTSADLGLRCMMVDDSVDAIGPQVKVVPFELEAYGEPPRPGDYLISIQREPVGTFMHFTRLLMDLRSPRLLPGARLPPDASPIEQMEFLHAVLEIDGERWVEVVYQRPGKTGQPAQTRKCLLKIHGLPATNVMITFVWFLLEFGIFMVGALAFWTRPFDRQARLFFGMCTVTLGAFVGGYHWWLIAGTLWLIVPFTICAMLVPVVTLHFFLVYPQPKRPLAEWPRVMLAALYAVPVVAMVIIVSIVMYSSWMYTHGASDQEIRRILLTLNQAIHIYLLIAGAYFVATLVALLNSFFTVRNPIVHSQVKWILWAGLVATLPVGYTLFLAQFHEVEFALGQATVPMFTASLLFMLAYAVGIVRYKLMLMDQLLSRGMLYYVMSLLLTVVYSVAIALGSLLGMYQTLPMSQQALSVVVTVLVTVMLLGWFRDRLQQLIDRRFFREKYQLDKALQRMNQAVGHLVEPDVLAERMLASCRDVLGVDRCALYLRHKETRSFYLLVTGGAEKSPMEFTADPELLELLREEGSIQRSTSAPHDARSTVQQSLWNLRIELMHALEVDGEVAGLVLLGPKRNATQFTAEDLTFLTALGQITSVALHSARVHQAVVRLNEELRAKVDKISEQNRMISMLQAEITGRQAVTEVADESTFRRDLIKGSSPAIQQVLDTVRKVASSHSSVLVRGESGTGKELLALALHENSPRSAAPMVSVHCGALSPGLLESELFGHVKGAFTGAHRDKIGRFEMANTGTLFLDEIGDISMETQIKLLRVLQQRSFEPVGGNRTIQVDVRLIAATHQNLEKLIAEGKFREDLFYRLNVISVTLPPLRERADDIFELALYFLGRAAQRSEKCVTHFDDSAVEALMRYSWPGNIRELENAVERAVVLTDGESISVDNLPPPIASAVVQPSPILDVRPRRSTLLTSSSEVLTLEAARSVRPLQEADEREQILQALEQCGGNKAEAARLLGMPRSTFFSKLKKYQ